MTCCGFSLVPSSKPLLSSLVHYETSLHVHVNRTNGWLPRNCGYESVVTLGMIQFDHLRSYDVHLLPHIFMCTLFVVVILSVCLSILLVIHACFNIQGVSLTNNLFDFYLLYLCQIADSFCKKYPACMFEMHFRLLLKFFADTVYILCKQLFNIKSKQNREHSTVFN